MGDGPVETFCGFLDFPMFTVLFLTQFRHSFVYFSPLSWRPLPLWYFTHWNHTRPPIHLPDSGSVEKRSGPGQKTQTFGQSRVVHICVSWSLSVFDCGSLRLTVFDCVSLRLVLLCFFVYYKGKNERYREYIKVYCQAFSWVLIDLTVDLLDLIIKSFDNQTADLIQYQMI